VTDFFSALELELTAASERRPRRPMGLGQVAGALAVVALLATAMAVALGVGGGGSAGGEQSGEIAAAPKPDPVGTVIPRGEGNPPRGRRTIVVAKGVAPINGPWQIEVSRTKGQRDTEGKLMWRRGWCMWINPAGCAEGSRRRPIRLLRRAEEPRLPQDARLQPRPGRPVRLEAASEGGARLGTRTRSRRAGRGDRARRDSHRGGAD
jgi:hypothetical protein